MRVSFRDSLQCQWLMQWSGVEPEMTVFRRDRRFLFCFGMLDMRKDLSKSSFR